MTVPNAPHLTQVRSLRPLVFRTRLRAWLVALAVILVAGTALAATYTYTAHHTTDKSPDHVYSVLTAYDQTCDSGCKYYGPNVVDFVKLDYKASGSRWYTWTHQSQTMKTTKYFSEVRVNKNSDGSFTLVTRQLDASDGGLVEELKQKTGKDHNPVFDEGKTTFTVKPIGGGKTKVTQAMRLVGTGMITMFGGKIEEGLKEGAAVTFKNIEK